MTTRLHRFRSQRRRHSARRSSARRRASTQPPLPEDASIYVCGCGNTFTAAVTATVTCPACGDAQAW